MKNIFVYILAIVSCSSYAQTVSIPDTNFKNYLLNNPAVNTNGDSEIQVTEANTFTGTLAFQFFFVNDLTGIEAFTNLTILDCGDNNLTNLDLSQNLALEQLYCYDNQLTNLDLSANFALQALDCRDNQISNLDVSGNPALYYLNCPFNGMQTLTINNTALETLRCYSNQLSSLNLNAINTLTTLVCNNNNFVELDLSNNTNVTSLDCSNNTLITLNVANTNNTNVSSFDARNNPDLDCIEVDNESYSTSNWPNINGPTVYSEDCSSLNISSFEINPVKVFPNPVISVLNIDVNEKAQLTIMSLNGQLISHSNLNIGVNKINVSGFSQGIYFIKIKNAKTNFVSRLVKQ